MVEVLASRTQAHVTYFQQAWGELAHLTRSFINSKRVYAISRNLVLVIEKAVIRAIDNLYQLDYEIKSGQVDRFYAFELFLLKFQRN